MPIKKTIVTQAQPPSNKTSYTPLLVGTLIVAAFILGTLVTKVTYLEKGGTTTALVPTTTAGQPPVAPVAPKVTIDQIKKLFNDKNITFGDKNSKNLLVEVADPSCPFCQVAAGYNPELSKQMGQQFITVADGGSYVPPVLEMKKLVDEGKAALIWIYTNGHGNGEMGTKAMYCAHEKGQFWPVHDKLMTNDGYNLLNNTVKNDKTKSADIATFLSDVTDRDDLQKCLESGKYDAKIQEDTATAANIGVNGTPGFYINATNFAGAYSWTDMKSAVK